MEPTRGPGRVPGDMGAMTASGTGPAAAVMRSFEDFYRAERDGLYRALALTLRDPGLAAEAVDEALARAFERWHRIGGYDSPAGWVYRVALNWATSWFRRRRREHPGLFEHPAVEQPLADPALTRAVDELPVHQRAVVVLRLYADWPTQQVAAALEIPAGTVKSRLSRALETLAARPEVTP